MLLLQTLALLWATVITSFCCSVHDVLDLLLSDLQVPHSADFGDGSHKAAYHARGPFAGRDCAVQKLGRRITYAVQLPLCCAQIEPRSGVASCLSTTMSETPAASVPTAPEGPAAAGDSGGASEVSTPGCPICEFIEAGPCGDQHKVRVLWSMHACSPASHQPDTVAWRPPLLSTPCSSCNNVPAAAGMGGVPWGGQGAGN
jgi:hypothetical protein